MSKATQFLVVLLIAGCSLHVSSLPTEPSLTSMVEEEVTESPTTVSSGNYSDAVVVEETAEDEGEDAGSDEAKEFDPNDCFLEKSRGPCRAVIDSWFFNVATKTCEPFMWSGCGGNNNRFREQSQCENQCMKGTSVTNDTTVSNSPAPSTTPAPATSSSTTESSSSSTTKAAPPKTKKIGCPKFEGCSPKCIVVQEQSNHGCKTCQCPLATDSETSSVKITRSTSKSESVKSPSVGSVSGLPSSSTDDDSSEGATEKPEDVCHLPPTRGHCRAMMTRYRYDAKVKDCVPFHFGGCDGNSNNFVTMEKCLEFCKGQ